MLYGAMNFPIRPVMEEIEALGALGFDYLELTMDPPRAHYSTIRELESEIKQALDRLGMGIVAHLPSFLFTADLTESIRRASVEEMIGCIETAAGLGAEKAVLHPSYILGLGRLVPDLSREYALESLSVMTEAAESAGVKLCIENMFPRAESRVEPDDFEEVFDRFPSLGFTLDVGHANIGGSGSRRCLAFIRRYPDRIEHVHMSDNFGKDDNHLPIGAGTVDFSKIVKALRNIGYDKTMTLEVFSRNRQYLKMSRDILADMIAEG